MLEINADTCYGNDPPSKVIKPPKAPRGTLILFRVS